MRYVINYLNITKEKRYRYVIVILNIAFNLLSFIVLRNVCELNVHSNPLYFVLINSHI